MADFVAVLKKTISGLSDNTPQMRERVYQKARDTVAARLAAMQPPPSPIVVERQKKALEAAISAVESSYGVEAEPEDEFAAIFAGPGKPKDTKPVVEAAADDAAPTPDKPAEPPKPAEPEIAPDETAKRPEAALMPKASGFAAAKEDADLKPVETTPRPDPVLAGSRSNGEKSGDGSTGEPALAAANRNRRRVSGGLIAAVAALLVVAAAGYGVWLNRDAFVALFAPEEEVAVTAPEPAVVPMVQEDTAPEETPAEEVAAVEEPQAAPQGEDPQLAEVEDEDLAKFTQRLTAEGSEVDPGPAGDETSVGEGTSVATATQPEGESAGGGTGETEAPASSEPALPVGQRAIFYEERTTVSQSTAETGVTVWSVVQESPGGDLPPEPAIRAEVTIPSKDLQLRITVRRNADPSLPASHIIEMIFLTPEGFEGGGIANVLRVAFKSSEAAPGNQLVGIPAKIADGYFLIALSSVEDEMQYNTQLMRQQSWIDIPIVYNSGRRALVTMERGVPGDRTFIDVLQTWDKLISEESSAAATAGN